MKSGLHFLASVLLFILFLLPFQKKQIVEIPTKQVKLLHENWSFTQQNSSNWKSATVPGTVHTDLLKHKLIPDPWYGTNEKQIQWVENKNWVYQTSFELTAKEVAYHSISLNFDGLDTYATVYLNGKEVGKAENMFRKWTFEVKNTLRVGKNTLKVVFESPIERLKQTVLNAPYELPASSEMVDLRVSPYVRKAPYHFGWDWGPRYVTCGIWRPAYLEFSQYVAIDEVTIDQVLLNKTEAIVQANVHLKVAQSGEYQLFVGGKVLKVKLKQGDTLLSQKLHIRHPKRWWPNGWGEANLYNVIVSVRKDGIIIDQKKERIGLRTIKLVQQKDKRGTSFYFKVNGVPIFVKGANYIPQSNFLPSVRKSQYDSLIHDAKVVNMNMLRVWGGGVYEDDYFYDLCDENGILVWQDFMFANTMYPFDSAFLGNVYQEAVYNVKRLHNHPCMAYWSGNNEIQVAWKGWGWQKKYAYTKEDSTALYHGYLKLFDTLLRNVVKTYSGGVAYNLTTPLNSYVRIPYDNSGDVHYWGVWHAAQDFVNYRKYIGRFVSEYGFQSFPAMETIRKFSSKKDWDINSEVMKWHQKSPIGNGMIQLKSDLYFPKASNFQEFVATSQLAQALAMQTAIDAHRLAKEYNGGTMYWQLNDCWPGPSWSGRDVYGRWKELHKRLSVLYANVAIIPQLIDGQLHLFAVNDLKDAKPFRIEFNYFNAGKLCWEKVFKKIIRTDKAYSIYIEKDIATIRALNNGIAYIQATIYDGKKRVFSRKIDRWDVLY